MWPIWGTFELEGEQCGVGGRGVSEGVLGVVAVVDCDVEGL
jgi:hypothetical protein